MGHQTLDGLHAAHRPQHAVVGPQNEKPDRQLRSSSQFTLADRAGHSCAALEPRVVEDAERVAIFGEDLRVSEGTPVGAPVHQSAQAQSGKPVVAPHVGDAAGHPHGSMTAAAATAVASTGVSVRDAYRLVSASYDDEPNPMLLLEQRFVERLLPPVARRNVVDLGCGTGRWLARLAPLKPASLTGIDISPEMLTQAGRKLDSQANLVLADCTSLLFHRSSDALILCSFLIIFLF